MSVRILIGDCRQRLKELPDNSVDSCVCDPPYHLTSIVKRFGRSQMETAGADQPPNRGAQYKRLSRGFMGQTWDGGDVAFQPETWAEVLRVIKPGGHLVAFGGTRTYHRLACAIEDAGFEIRDTIFYCYGSGFPKSLNVHKSAKNLVCRCGSSQVSQRDLRLVRQSDVSTSEYSAAKRGEVLFEGVQEQSAPAAGWTQSAYQAGVEEPRVEGRGDVQAGARELQRRQVCARSGMGAADGEGERLHNGAPAGDGADVRLPADANGSREPQGSQPGEQSPVEPGALADERGSQARGSWPLCDGCGKPIIPEGLGTALKPAVEPICLARKPLVGTVAQNVLTHGTGALNIDGCRIEGEPWKAHTATGLASEKFFTKGDAKLIDKQPHDLGRWPANVAHDGSPEVLAGFPDKAGSNSMVSGKASKDGFLKGVGNNAHHDTRASGGAERFFYTAKATTEERGEGNNHPTVKPIALMRWLCRLVTPKGGTVLDPFMGSGSTGLAAEAEQFDFIGCEMSPEYAAIAERRIREAAGMFADVKVAA